VKEKDKENKRWGRIRRKEGGETEKEDEKKREATEGDD